MDIGFVGLGRMGGPMAANLARQGHRVWGYDIAPEALERARGTGVLPAASAREASQGRTAVFLSLTYPSVVEEAVVGERGVLSALPVPPLLVDLSTGIPSFTRRLAAVALEKGCQLLDAPVSGLPEGARTGTLSIMVGGPITAFERAMPLLKVLGKNVNRIGDVGAGHAMKLVNNVITGITRVAVAEALLLGRLAGIDPDTIFQVISVSTGNSRTFQDMASHVLKGDFDPRGDVNTMHKDMTNITRFAEELGLPLPLSNMAKQMYQTAKATGLAAKDASAVLILFERLMGVEVRGKTAQNSP